MTWLIHVCDYSSTNLEVYFVDHRKECVICDMTHVHMWHDSFMCVTKAQLISRSTSWVARNGVSYVTWLTIMCIATHSCVWCDSFMCVHVAQQISRSTSLVARNGASYVTWNGVAYVTWNIYIKCVCVWMSVCCCMDLLPFYCMDRQKCCAVCYVTQIHGCVTV